MKKGLLLLLIALIVLTGCTHKSPYVSPYYFQAMGDEGEIVITLDANKIKSESPSLLEDMNLPSIITDRTDRVSLSLYKDSVSETDRYPALMQDFEYYGAIEGNFGSSINMALSFISEFNKVKSNKIKYYESEALSIGLAQKGVVLFASDDYEKAYDKTIKNRVLFISDDIAEKMHDSMLGIYTKKPKTLFDLGFELPQTVLSQMDEALIYMRKNEDKYFMYAAIGMNDKSGARALNTLLRNNVVQETRREGLTLDTKALAKIYYYDENMVYIYEKEMKDSEVELFMSKVSSSFVGVF